MRHLKTDILVVGSGIAGLSFALKAAAQHPELKVTVATKGEFEEGSTRYAQGGIAVVMDNLRDNFEKHIEDTMSASGGYADREIVEMVVRQAPERLKELEAKGALFDKKAGGEPDLALEGGHSAPRVVHARDSTGREVARALSTAVKDIENIEVFTFYFAVDLFKDPDTGACLGVYFLDKEGIMVCVSASITLLATGGSGQLFNTTTNPLIATGDGVAIAARAGATLCDMHTVQFHPTAFYHPGDNPSLLITEALRGFGAYVLNSKGERFILKTDPRGELSTRDIVTRAIWQEMKNTGEPCVYLDVRHLDIRELDRSFPAIMANCRKAGIEPSESLIPVAPAAHYQCGGILTDLEGRTHIPGLLAAGECASTGLHGRNRLASNSLLEALVFAHAAAEYISKHLHRVPNHTEKPTPVSCDASYPPKEVAVARKKLRVLMSGYFTGVNSAEPVKNYCRAIRLSPRPDFLPSDIYTLELRNLIELAMLVVHQAEKQEILPLEARKNMRADIEKIWTNYLL
jgi:L-aspartate oxidase